MRFLLPIILLCLTACQSEVDLIGHWHVEATYPESNGIKYEEHYTFDILNDTMISMWSYAPSGNGLYSSVDKEAKKIYRRGECFTYDWSYEVISRDVLKITDNQSTNDKQIKVIRKTNCTIETHLSMNSKLNIKLPEAESSGIELDAQSSLLRHYSVGPAKENYASFYRSSFHYQLGDKISTPADLPIFEEQHLVKMPENKRRFAKSVILANAETPANCLNGILSYTCGRNNETLYFATLQRSPDTTILWYQPVVVRSATAPESLTVAEWLLAQQ